MSSNFNRLTEKVKQVKRKKQKLFCAYITLGYPNVSTTEKLILSLDKAGVDILELGFPFSDPLADGVVNQLAADRALKSGTTLKKILHMIKKLRSKGLQIPIVLFTYFNPIHRYGLEKFAQDAAQAGVDGVLNLDLPPEESDSYSELMEKAGLHPIYLIAPTTSSSRLHSMAQKSRGFIYYVSREGVTGMQKSIHQGILSRVNEIRRHTKVPIVVGFGISNPKQVRQVAYAADGCVVGSAIVKRVGEFGKKSSLVSQVTCFVSSLIKPLRR